MTLNLVLCSAKGHNNLHSKKKVPETEIQFFSNLVTNTKMPSLTVQLGDSQPDPYLMNLSQICWELKLELGSEKFEMSCPIFRYRELNRNCQKNWTRFQKLKRLLFCSVPLSQFSSFLGGSLLGCTRGRL